MKLLRKNGQLIVVLRPADPATAIARAREIMAMPHATGPDLLAQADAFSHVLTEQPYQVKGYMAAGVGDSRETGGKHGVYCDRDGNVLGAIEEGDSMADERVLNPAHCHVVAEA